VQVDRGDDVEREVDDAVPHDAAAEGALEQRAHRLGERELEDERAMPAEPADHGVQEVDAVPREVEGRPRRVGLSPGVRIVERPAEVEEAQRQEQQRRDPADALQDVLFGSRFRAVQLPSGVGHPVVSRQGVAPT